MTYWYEARSFTELQKRFLFTIPDPESPERLQYEDTYIMQDASTNQRVPSSPCAASQEALKLQLSCRLQPYMSLEGNSTLDRLRVKP